MSLHISSGSPGPEKILIFTLTLLVLASQGLSGIAFAADSVSALGRLEPEDGVILVSAPLTSESTSGAVVAELLVETGQDVEQGQLLAVMEAASLAQAYLVEAQAAYDLAVKRVEAAKSSAEESCVRARVAASESERRAALFQKGVAGEEEAETAAGLAEALAAGCVSARTSARVAESEVELSGTRIELRKAQYERTLVKAPRSGRILAIHAWPGEMAALQGLLELGQVEQMYAIAEVYETDIDRVKLGQRATVSSDALVSVLNGTVSRIHQKVAKMDAIGTDPAARKDARIVEVEIKLDDSASAASLTYLQVAIEISPES